MCRFVNPLWSFWNPFVMSQRAPLHLPVQWNETLTGVCSALWGDPAQYQPVLGIWNVFVGSCKQRGKFPVFCIFLFFININIYLKKSCCNLYESRVVLLVSCGWTLSLGDTQTAMVTSWCVSPIISSVQMVWSLDRFQMSNWGCVHVRVIVLSRRPWSRWTSRVSAPWCWMKTARGWTRRSSSRRCLKTPSSWSWTKTRTGPLVPYGSSVHIFNNH